MRSDRILGLALCSLVAACGSSGGTYPGDEQPVIDDASIDTTAPPKDGGNPVQDSGFPQDSTTPPPQLDATLDVNLGDGAIWTADSGGGTDAGGQDGGGGCAPDGILCSGNVAETCKNGQLSTTTCPGLCADGYGCVTCVPGSGTCSGSTGQICKSDGSGYVTNNCDPQLGLTCNGGVCLGDCSASNIGQSYIGCEYYAVTMLNNWLDQTTFSFAISVANTTSKSATVTITGPHPVAQQTVPAGAIVSVVLPWESPISCGTGPCNGGQPLAPTTAITAGGAYHIKSTEPVTVYQFNPRDYQLANVTCASDPTSPPCHSFSNDASLLIPVNALTGNYYVATYPSFYTLPGLIDIVGTQAGTSVKVSPSVSIVAGGGLLSNGGTATLNAGDVLQITNPTPGTGSYGSDMSGSLIAASAPVEVFGGQACVYIPANSPGYCDHMEEVMFPLETLQKDYFVVPPNVTGITAGSRLSAPSHVVRIVGTAAGTTLTYSPQPTVISGAASTTVGAGGVVVFETSTPFHLTSTQPVLVSMYMESSTNYSSTNYMMTGDPSQTVAVPTAQFRNSYPFTAPNNYQVNWATVIAPTGNTVTIDSTTIAANQFIPIGTSGYGYYHYAICNGNCGASSSNHTASSAKPFGIQVYGYGAYTSYWYPGGLNLTR